MSGCGSKDSVRKIFLPNGFQVGIQNLDKVLSDVADLGLADDQAIEKELMIRIAKENYIPASAEKEYASALMRAFDKKFGSAADTNQKPTKKKHAG